MVKKVDLSIIIPMYNSEKYIEDILIDIKNFVEKDNLAYEVLLIDDGSTDKTKVIVQNFIKDFDYFRLVLANHGGVSRARNIGINNSQGSYITFVDSDDRLDFKNFSQIKQGMKMNYDIIMVNMPERLNLNNPSLNEKIEAWKIINSKPGLEAPWAKFYRKGFIEKNNLRFDENLSIGEDTMFGYNAITVSSSILFLPLKFYRHGEEHTLGHFKKEMLQSDLIFIDSLQELVKAYQQTKNFEELLYIINRYKDKEFFRLIRDYYTPLFQQKTKTLSDIQREMKQLAKKWNMNNALSHDSYGKKFWIKRQRMYAALIKREKYKEIIILETIIKKIKDRH